MVFRWMFLIVLCGVLAACGNQSAQLPTLIPATNAPTAQIPSATATASEVAATATQRLRPTFPPTFTPTATETETATPTVNVPTPTLFVPQNTLPAGCSTFNVDYAKSNGEFKVGEAPAAAWTAAEGAVRYRVSLYGSGGVVLRDDIYVAETSFTFDASLFQAGFLYGWEVYPINANNDQMCFAVGRELLPQKDSIFGS